MLDHERARHVALAARLVPNRDHSACFHRVQENRKPEDVFPTGYRCNSRGKLPRASAATGSMGSLYGTKPAPSRLALEPPPIGRSTSPVVPLRRACSGAVARGDDDCGRAARRS